MLIQANDFMIPGIFYIYRSCVYVMNSRGLYNWNTAYPAAEILNDIDKGYLYLWEEEEIATGVVCLNKDQPEEYFEKSWESDSPYLVVHRLAVHPKYQNKGIAEKMMKDACRIAKENGFKSIRLDVFTGNPSAVRLYEKLGYSPRGEIHFKYQEVPFMCMEKEI